ncbi:hypothetical protein H5410_028621 [Solanum commersonii]|uniref:Protein kinase domain-containing protein n=1 Tax=Solanum commersonii TaxID=4109 RepID=A0A9J5Z2M3_SOLCO|nr:hypothetical protein H5410_028621 [Solanum commersonii]
MVARRCVPRFIPEFTYHPRPGSVFIERNTGTKYVLLEIIGINYVQLLHTQNHNTFDLIYKACYYTYDWIDNDSFLPSGYATVKFIRPGKEVPRSMEAGNSIPNSNIINVKKWVIQRFQGAFCVALPYMSEGSLRYILSIRFNNGLPEDCIAIALKQALLGLFDLHDLDTYFKVEIKLGFAATIYDSELESPISVSHQTELGADPTITILPKYPGGHPNYASCTNGLLRRNVLRIKIKLNLHMMMPALFIPDIWLVGVAALELAYGNLRISSREEFEAMIKKIKRSRRLPDKLEDLLEEINVEEGKGKGKMKKAVVYFNDKLKYVKGKRKFSKEFEELVLDCLSSKESKRPSVGDLLQRPFFRDFFPSEAEEEACKVNNTPWLATRELVDIRDLYPAPKIDSENTWQIKKKITHDEIFVGMMVIPFFKTIEYILRYWTLDMAKNLFPHNTSCIVMTMLFRALNCSTVAAWVLVMKLGCFHIIQAVQRFLYYNILNIFNFLSSYKLMLVGLWNVTEQNDRPNRYEDGSFTFRKLRSDDYSLSCMTLINDHGLGVGDKIELCWNPIISKFIFKLISKVCMKKIIS